jgi:hypothetical protein
VIVYVCRDVNARMCVSMFISFCVVSMCACVCTCMRVAVFVYVGICGRVRVLFCVCVHIRGIPVPKEPV